MMFTKVKIEDPFASTIELYPFRAKILFPPNAPPNLIGLLLGPKGICQKRLEEQSGCKILIRGKNSHKLQDQASMLSPDDKDEAHILVMGDAECKVIRAKEMIEKLIFADEATKQQIRLEQLKTAQLLSLGQQVIVHQEII